MKIAIGCDHGGFNLKSTVVKILQEKNIEITDFGTNSSESVDYPDFAHKVANAVSTGEVCCGILICGTGIGMSICANKHKGVRATLCHDAYTAKMSREHNNSNLLCMGERVTGPGVAEDIVRIWLETDFAGGRHERRTNKFDI